MEKRGGEKKGRIEAGKEKRKRIFKKKKYRKRGITRREREGGERRKWKE